jgi:hypothetical protein
MMMIMRSYTYRLASLALTLMLPHFASAQDSRADHDCTKAARIVAKGHPEKMQEVAYTTLLSCPTESAQVFIGVISDLRTSTDTAAFKWLLLEGTEFRDGTVFEAARAVAQDAGATPEARAYSLVMLDRLLDRANYRPVLLPRAGIDAAAIRTRECRSVSVTDIAQQPGATPLPSDASARLHALASRLANDASAPPLLRRTAACMQ